MPVFIPDGHPRPGFYRSWKHDPSVDFRNFTYEVRALGSNAKTGLSVVYRPLYEDAPVYQASRAIGMAVVDDRPLSEWLEPVVVDGVEKPRYVRVTDPSEIRQLEHVRDMMYPTKLEVPAAL